MLQTIEIVDRVGVILGRHRIESRLEDSTVSTE